MSLSKQRSNLSVDDNGGSLTVVVALRNGSLVVNLASGGTLITSGNGAASGAIRVTLADDSTGLLAQVTNVATIGSSVSPGVGHLGKAEDGAHTDGPTGVWVDTAAGTAPGTDTPEFGWAIPGATTGAAVTSTFPVGAAFYPRPDLLDRHGCR